MTGPPCVRRLKRILTKNGYRLRDSMRTNWGRPSKSSLPLRDFFLDTFLGPDPEGAQSPGFSLPVPGRRPRLTGDEISQPLPPSPAAIYCLISFLREDQGADIPPWGLPVLPGLISNPGEMPGRLIPWWHSMGPQHNEPATNYREYQSSLISGENGSVAPYYCCFNRI